MLNTFFPNKSMEFSFLYKKASSGILLHLMDLKISNRLLMANLLIKKIKLPVLII